MQGSLTALLIKLTKLKVLIKFNLLWALFYKIAACRSISLSLGWSPSEQGGFDSAIKSVRENTTVYTDSGVHSYNRLQTGLNQIKQNVSQ